MRPSKLLPVCSQCLRIWIQNSNSQIQTWSKA
jgi:hypothetical protein